MEKTQQTRPLREKSSKPTINTHNLIVDFGKFRGERWTRIPLSYLRWLINENTQYANIAKAEIERRGASLTADKEIELSGHAIDKASLRLRKTWHETALDNNEGLFSWLERVASEAYQNIAEDSDNVIHSRIKFVFMKGELYPVLKTVMPAPRIHYRRSNTTGLINASFKGVFMTLKDNNDSLIIQQVRLENSGKTQTQQMIDVIRDDYPDKKITISPLVDNTLKSILVEKEIKENENN